MVKTLSLMALAAQLCSCASSATFVSRDLGRGHLRLHGAYMRAYASARELITEYCHGPAIVREEISGVSFQCESEPPRMAEIACCK